MYGLNTNVEANVKKKLSWLSYIACDWFLYRLDTQWNDDGNFFQIGKVYIACGWYLYWLGT